MIIKTRVSGVGSIADLLIPSSVQSLIDNLPEGITGPINSFEQTFGPIGATCVALYGAYLLFK